MLITLGFDPAKKKYVGSWVGSMMPQLWTYEGALDPTGRILALESQGPSFEDPTKTSLYRDTIERGEALLDQRQSAIGRLHQA